MYDGPVLYCSLWWYEMKSNLLEKWQLYCINSRFGNSWLWVRFELTCTSTSALKIERPPSRLTSILRDRPNMARAGNAAFQFLVKAAQELKCWNSEDIVFYPRNFREDSSPHRSACLFSMYKVWELMCLCKSLCLTGDLWSRLPYQLVPRRQVFEFPTTPSPSSTT